jgi:hypothetical protein
MTTRKISELKPYEKNARKHPEAQLKQLKNSIKEFGFTAPVLVDENNLILAGHGRLEAAKLAGMEEVPVRVIEGLTEAQKRAYVLADNRIALNAEWDYELLKEELSALGGFDLPLIGFGFKELESLLPTPEGLFDEPVLPANTKALAPGGKPTVPNLPASNIEMVHLFFTAEQNAVFRKAVNVYMDDKGFDNLTDAVFNMVMEATK